jgi:hypothetical protein
MVLEKMPESKFAGPPWRWIMIGVVVAAILVLAIFALYPDV